MFDGNGSVHSKLNSPWGLSVGSDGNIIVVDTGDKFIKIFSPNGKFLTKIGGKGSLTFPVFSVVLDISSCQTEMNTLLKFSTGMETLCTNLESGEKERGILNIHIVCQ